MQILGLIRDLEPVWLRSESVIVTLFALVRVFPSYSFYPLIHPPTLIYGLEMPRAHDCVDYLG